MSSEIILYFAGIIFTYVLQVAAAYLLVSVLSRLLHRPRQRFFLWMAFLSGSAIYWAGLMGWNLQRAVAHHLVIGDMGPGSVSAWPSIFVVPRAWSGSILLASRLVVVAYAGAVALLLGVGAWRHLRLRLVLRHGQPPSEALAALFEQTRSTLGVSRCELLVLPGLGSPATAGWLRPRILLPAICEDLGPSSRLADVLQHELAHVARGDYFWAGLSDLICRLLFFHPTAWSAKRFARLQCELACDLAVIETRPEHRADYADSLAYFVRLRMLEERTALGMDFAAAPSSLGARIRFILETPKSLPWWKQAARSVTGLALSAGFAVVVPALTVLLAFARPIPAAAPAYAQSSAVHPDRGLRKATLHRREISGTPYASRINAQSPVRETRVYSLTANHSNTGSEPVGNLDGGWREPTSVPKPSVIGAVRSAIIGIAIGRGHDRDRDRDDHFAPQ